MAYKWFCYNTASLRYCCPIVLGMVEAGAILCFESFRGIGGFLCTATLTCKYRYTAWRVVLGFEENADIVWDSCDNRRAGVLFTGKTTIFQSLSILNLGD